MNNKIAKTAYNLTAIHRFIESFYKSYLQALSYDDPRKYDPVVELSSIGMIILYSERFINECVKLSYSGSKNPKLKAVIKEFNDSTLEELNQLKAWDISKYKLNVTDYNFKIQKFTPTIIIDESSIRKIDLPGTHTDIRKLLQIVRSIKSKIIAGFWEDIFKYQENLKRAIEANENETDERFSILKLKNETVIKNREDFDKALKEIEKYSNRTEASLSPDELKDIERLALAIQEYENLIYG